MPPTQSAQPQPRDPARQTHSGHRSIRLGQILPRLSHALRRGPTALCGNLLALCPAVFRSHGQTGCRRDRRHPARHRDRTKKPHALNPLDRRHAHGDQRLPQTALHPRGHRARSTHRRTHRARFGHQRHRMGDATSRRSNGSDHLRRARAHRHQTHGIFRLPQPTRIPARRAEWRDRPHRRSTKPNAIAGHGRCPPGPHHAHPRQPQPLARSDGSSLHLGQRPRLGARGERKWKSRARPQLQRRLDQPCHRLHAAPADALALFVQQPSRRLPDLPRLRTRDRHRSAKIRARSLTLDPQRCDQTLSRRTRRRMPTRPAALLQGTRHRCQPSMGGPLRRRAGMDLLWRS